MKVLRGCLLYVVAYLLTAALYVRLLHPPLRPGPAVILGLFGALLLCLLVSSVLGFVGGLRDRARIADAETGRALPEHGERIAAIGRLEAIGEPLEAPWSGHPAVLWSYEVERDSILRAREADGRLAAAKPVKDWHGLALTRTVLRTESGDVRLLAFPDLDHVPRLRFDDPDAWERAARLIERVGPGAGVVSPRNLLANLASFTEVLSDEGGAIERHWRHGDPPALEPGEHRLFERSVGPGEQVVLLGRWSAERRGLVGGVRWGELIQLVPGDAEAARRTLVRTGIRQVTIAAAFCAAIHGMIAFAVWVESGGRARMGALPVATAATEQAGRAGDGRTIHALVATGDTEAIRAYAAAGGSLDLVDASGAAPVFSTGDVATRRLLLELGASPNARDHEGDTWLQEEVREGDSDLATALVEAGAELEATSANGDTALAQAITADDRAMIAMLTTAGAVDFRVGAAKGRPLPEDGGPPFAVVRAYLEALGSGDVGALSDLVHWEVAATTRPDELTALRAMRPAGPVFSGGFWNGRAATLTVRGAESSQTTTWGYHLVVVDAAAMAEAPAAPPPPPTDPAKWRIEREWWLIEER